MSWETEIEAAKTLKRCKSRYAREREPFEHLPEGWRTIHDTFRWKGFDTNLLRRKSKNDDSSIISAATGLRGIRHVGGARMIHGREGTLQPNQRPKGWKE
jgi:hypothetical protein